MEENDICDAHKILIGRIQEDIDAVDITDQYVRELNVLNLLEY